MAISNKDHLKEVRHGFSPSESTEEVKRLPEYDDELTSELIPVSDKTVGAKLDDGKIDMSLLEYLPRAVYEVCRVMTYGKLKYARGGFLDVPDALNRYRAARGRHENKLDRGIVFDVDPFYDTPEGKQFKNKIYHKAQVAVNAMFELEIYLRQIEEGKEGEN